MTNLLASSCLIEFYEAMAKRFCVITAISIKFAEKKKRQRLKVSLRTGYFLTLCPHFCFCQEKTCPYFVFHIDAVDQVSCSQGESPLDDLLHMLLIPVRGVAVDEGR